MMKLYKILPFFILFIISSVYVCAVCGNYICEAGETVTCPNDCAGYCRDANCGDNCPTPTTCVRETCSSCPTDCGACCTPTCTVANTYQCPSGQLQQCQMVGACLKWVDFSCTESPQCSVCGSNMKCSSGTCVSSCPDGICDASTSETCEADNCCSGVKVNFLTDPNNCGHCSNKCLAPTTQCDSGVCKEPVECSSPSDCADDGNPCTTTACVSNKCQYNPNNNPCNDGNSCTVNDVCSSGVCSGQPKDCDDSNICTADSCNPSTGCVYSNQPSSTQCGTDTSCSYTSCSGTCGRTGTYTDYHCTGFGSCQGYATTCSPLTCSAGTKCSSGSCVSATETCNNIDDNCNGQVDENLQTSSGCNQVGYCSGSYKTCSAGIWGACSKTPQTEVCDGIDNNCNGQIDEGCDDDADGYCDDNMEIKAAVTGSTGLCKNEIDAPPANSKGTDCDDDEKNSNPGKTEICDFLDNNCNGQIDENGVCSCDKLLGLGKTEKAKISKNKP